MATAYIKELVNATSSEIVYPVTKSQAVYMSDNSTTVQKAIDDLSALKNVPALDSQTTPNVSDLLTIFRSTNSTGYKALVSDVAKTIIESYQSSSLAGKTQSVKAALDSLNSRTAFQLTKSIGTWPEEITLQGASYAIKQGFMCQVHLNLKIMSETKKSLTIDDLIPVGMRPQYEVQSVGGDGDTDGIAQPCSIRQDGGVSLWNTKTGTTYLQVDVTYIVANS